MDRQIIYPGSIPLDTDLLSTSRNVLVGLGKLAAMVLGTTTQLNGLACGPTAPATMQVQVGAGEIYSLQTIDGSAYGSLPADTAHTIVKQGVLLDSVLLSCPAPTTSGQSINYLVQIAYQDVDSVPVVLPYYNSSNPTQAYSGPNNAGTPNMTVRAGKCVASVKAGASATTGTQVTPAPDAGYVGAYVVTVAYGATSITSGNISVYSGAPFVTERLKDKISVATGDARYVQPAALGSYLTAANFTGGNQSLGTSSGFQKLPGGFILQWVNGTTVPNSGGTANITWPTAFPNACIGLQISVQNAADSQVGYSAKNTAGATLKTGVTDATNRVVDVLAFGF